MKLNSKHTGSKSTIAALSAVKTFANNLRAKTGELGDFQRRTLGTEGFSEATADSGSSLVATELSKVAPKLGKLSGAQHEALTCLAASIPSPSAYAQKLLTESFDSGKKWANGDGQGAESTLNTEYFSDQVLAKHIENSMVLNLRVTQQTPYAEKMYRTVTIDPSDTGATFRAKRLRVHNGMIHSLDPNVAKELDARNATDGLTDHTVLEGNILELVPFKNPDGSADDHFVPSSLWGDEVVKLTLGVSVPTGFLSFDKRERVSYLGLCAHPQLVGADILNESDEIAEGASLSSILINVRAKGESLEDGKMVVLTTLGRAYAGLQKTPEGDGRQLQLSFRNNIYDLNAESLDYAGATIPALKALESQGLQICYEVRVNSYMNTSTSKEEMSSPEVIVRRVLNRSGVEVTSDAIKTILDNIVITAVGYKYASTLTNLNRRSAGQLADSYWYEENYKVRLTSPVTTKTPVDQDVADSSRLEDLISLINIRNENLAVTRTLAETEIIKEVHKVIRNDFDPNVGGLTGIARHFIRPWYAENVIDFRDKRVLTKDSREAVANARVVLVDTLRAQVSVALQRSRYLTTMRASSNQFDKRPKVLITCDTVVADLLQLIGEAHLLSKEIESEVVTTNDNRYYPWDESEKSFRRRLQWVFTIDTDTNEYQIYGWGTHLWCPPCVTNTVVPRNGGLATELTVQPRNLHIVNCPITGVIYLLGLEEWMAARKFNYVAVEGEVTTTETTTP